ncbi:DUF2318 domain-containing protein [Clostridium aminobutyricum]|uniref:DUF2318 domain-containing protein n=1 Tax=Clostridium aminobutyricum TaxID=33953 RepID=A0A939IHE9_CLOAM|nr:DUF2318 domain-containing protein [Clostridium aminobutyricum]MBN7771851.1 DUF2318 domain-containing protein [Clostridium aminobutyricum]
MQEHNVRLKNTTRKVMPGILLALILLFSLTACSEKSSASNDADPNAEQQRTISTVSEDSGLVIPVGDITEKAAFYPVDVDGTKMEVIAVKAPDGTIRTAFNTCQVCYDSGRGYYVQSGDKLVCQNCGNQFSMDRVEVEAGGCNPYPIFKENKTVTDDSITISYDFLKESKDIFANWK